MPTAMIRRQFRADDSVVLVGDVAGDPAAPTVVLMHGAGQTRHSWSSTMRTLVDAGYHVINYDARGHGESEWSRDGRYSFPLRAADLRSVIAEVDGPFALIGASMGGITALQAIGEGLRPCAVVLVDIVLRPEPSGVQRIRDFMMGHTTGFATLDEAAEAVAAYNPARRKRPDPSGLMRNLRGGPDGRFRWHWDPRILPDDAREDIVAMERIIELLAPAREIPMLLIRGSRSDVLSDANVADFRQSLPQVELLDVANAGHMVAGDSNELFTLGVIEYFERHCFVGARGNGTDPSTEG
jgi:pimeloyl-ACP methyl ester carboxylesterase